MVKNKYLVTNNIYERKKVVGVALELDSVATQKKHMSKQQQQQKTTCNCLVIKIIIKYTFIVNDRIQWR